jgi:hypothetical protein
MKPPLATVLAIVAVSSFGQTAPNTTIEQPDADRTRNELTQLLDRYPPSLHSVLALDPSLLGSQPYLAPYPALVSFLAAHPEIPRNPAFYVGKAPAPPDRRAQFLDVWRDMMAGLAALTAFGMAIGLLTWLIRTLVNYRRWTRLTKVQTDVHTKLVDRFTANEDLLAYIQTPAGAKFLESTPITLDPGPRSISAPLGRILWAVQAGVVLIAGGVGLQIVSNHIVVDISQPLRAFGVLGVALGIGFAVSAVVSYFISRRLGLIEPVSRPVIAE